MALRFICDIPGLEANWVDVAEVWTRAELRALGEADGPGLLAFLRDKLAACHIERVQGSPITDPSELDETALDEIDIRLVDFLGTVLLQAGVHLRSLGNLSGRLSSDGSARVLERTRTTV